jgi:hypothetical protein
MFFTRVRRNKIWGHKFGIFFSRHRRKVSEIPRVAFQYILLPNKNVKPRDFFNAVEAASELLESTPRLPLITGS